MTPGESIPDGSHISPLSSSTLDLLRAMNKKEGLGQMVFTAEQLERLGPVYDNLKVSLAVLQSESVAPPQAALPEAPLEAGDPFMALQELLSLPPAEETAFLQLMAEKQEALTRSYLGDPYAQRSVTTLTNCVRWMYTGKIGQRLPGYAIQPHNSAHRGIEHVIDPMGPVDSSVEAQIDKVLIANVAPGISKDKAEALRKAVRAAIATSPGYTLLRALELPPQTTRERLLTPSEQARRIGVITAELCSSYMMPLDELLQDPNGRLEYTRATLPVDEETILDRRQSGQDPEGLDRVRLYLAAELSRHYTESSGSKRRLRPEEIQWNGYTLYVKGKGGPLLDATLDKLVTEINGSPLRDAPHNVYLRKRIRNAFDPLPSAPWQDDMPLEAATVGTAQNLIYRTSNWTYQANMQSWAWALRTPFDTVDKVSAIPVGTRKVQNYVDQEYAERSKQQIVGALLYDGRTEAQRSDGGAQRLIVPGVLPEALPTHSAEPPVLVLSYTAAAYEEWLGAGGAPAIPGYVLTGARTTADSWEFDFIADTAPDPYRPCEWPIDNARWNSVTHLAEQQGYGATAQAFRGLQPSTPHTMAQAMRKTGYYYTPQDTAEAARMNAGMPPHFQGAPLVQCVPAQKLFADWYNNLELGTATVVGGVVLPAAPGPLTAAGHAQTRLQKAGEMFIIDATPTRQYGESMATDLSHLTDAELSAVIARLEARLTGHTLLPSEIAAAAPFPKPVPAPISAPLQETLPPPVPLPPRTPKPAEVPQPEVLRAESITAGISAVRQGFLSLVRLQLGLERQAKYATEAALWKVITTQYDPADPLRVIAKHIAHAALPLSEPTLHSGQALATEIAGLERSILSMSKRAERTAAIEASAAKYPKAARRLLPSRLGSSSHTAAALREYGTMLATLSGYYKQLAAYQAENEE